MYLVKNVFKALIVSVLLASCDNELTDLKADKLESNPVPLTIDYNEQDGSLSQLAYRAIFVYNADNQLVSVVDTLLTPVHTQSVNALPWVNFYYQNGRLSEIVLRSNEGPYTEYRPETDTKASHFYFTYNGDSIQTLLTRGSQQQGFYNFKIDANGFPIRQNVHYGSVFLDAAGNIDFVAENDAAKAQNPLGSQQTLNLKYDKNKNVFANSKEFQMLGVLLAAYNWNMTTSLVPYLGILTSHNELAKTQQYCSKEGCQAAATILSETSSVNSNGFPTRRLTQVGAMGRYQYLIKYR